MALTVWPSMYFSSIEGDWKFFKAFSCLVNCKRIETGRYSIIKHAISFQPIFI